MRITSSAAAVRWYDKSLAVPSIICPTFSWKVGETPAEDRQRFANFLNLFYAPWDFLSMKKVWNHLMHLEGVCSSDQPNGDDVFSFFTISKRNISGLAKFCSPKSYFYNDIISETDESFFCQPCASFWWFLVLCAFGYALRRSSEF